MSSDHLPVDPGLPAIEASGLSKCYQIYARPSDRLKQALFPRWRRWLGLQPRRYFREFWALREVGFTAQVLVTEEWRDMLLGRVPAPPSNGDGFDVESLVEIARRSLDFDRDIAIAATNQESRAYGFLPPYHFATWHCHKPR